MTRTRAVSYSQSAFTLGLVAVLGLALASCAKEDEVAGTPAGASEKKAPDESATRVEVARFEGGENAGRFVRPGEVIGAREATLAAALGGFVERVFVRSGQDLTKGQIIARIDSSTHGAQLELARVEVEDAERELSRLSKMGKAIARARVDAAKTRVARAKAQQRVAQTRMRRATLRAPFAGTLVDLQIEEGEVAAPGQPVGRILVLDPIAVSVSVTDQDVHSLTMGSPVRIATAGSAAQLAGKVSRVEPAADLRTRTFLIEVQAPNPDRKLLPGMIATVEFQPQVSESSLLLPQDLLVTKLEENGVFTVGDDNTAHWRPLELGEILGGHVEVLSGISRGELFVTVGMRSLADGEKVIVTREGWCCTNGSVVFDGPKKPKQDATFPTRPASKAAKPASKAANLDETSR